MEKSEIDRINKWFNSKPKWFLYGVDRFVEEVYSGTSISWGVVV